MNATERYKYALLPQIKLKLKKKPIGRMARRYMRPVILTVFRPSSRVVVRASSWVMKVANIMCHAVSVMGNPGLVTSCPTPPQVMAILKPRVSRSHLLKRMTPPLKPIHVLSYSSVEPGNTWGCATYTTYAAGCSDALGGSGFSAAGLTVGNVDISTGLCCSPETRTFFSLSAMVVRGTAVRVRKA